MINDTARAIYNILVYFGHFDYKTVTILSNTLELRRKHFVALNHFIQEVLTKLKKFRPVSQ